MVEAYILDLLTSLGSCWEEIGNQSHMANMANATNLLEHLERIFELILGVTSLWRCFYKQKPIVQA